MTVAAAHLDVLERSIGGREREALEDVSGLVALRAHDKPGHLRVEVVISVH
jgi:hypothetical protein